MDFWSTCKVLLRRWYVAAPVFLAALAVAGLVFLTVPASYESTGTIVLTSPSEGATVEEGPDATRERINPLLVFDGGLMVTSQILVQQISSSAFAEQIARSGGTATIEAGNGGLDGPFVVVVATGDSAEAAERTVQLAMQVSQDDLVERQRRLGAPESTFIGVEEVVAPSAATMLIGGPTRYAAVALGLGFFAALCSAYMIESFLLSRRERSNGPDVVPSAAASGAAGPGGGIPQPDPQGPPVPEGPRTVEVEATRPIAARSPRPSSDEHQPSVRPSPVPRLPVAAGKGPVNGRRTPSPERLQ